MTDPLYYTRLSDFKAGMEVDNKYVGRCKVIEAHKDKDRIVFSDGTRCIYSCRGWVTVEYEGDPLDGSPNRMYQRSDPIIGISETDVQFKYKFSVDFREIGLDDAKWPEPRDTISGFDGVRPGELCSSPHWRGSIRKETLTKNPGPAEHIDPRDGEPCCWDCYEELIND